MRIYPILSSLLLRCIICLSILCSFSNRVLASHIVGADMFYTWISGNTYKITVVLYGDCGPASAAVFAQLPTGTPQVCVYDGNTLVSTLSLPIQAPSAGVEITPVCPGELTQCTNTSYALPGIKKFVYSINYTLPNTSALWRFIFNGNHGSAVAGRAAAITNILSGSTIQLIDTLNNSTVPGNSNPLMTTIPTPFFCLNQSDSYNPGAVDGDGDNLLFTLVAATNGVTTCTSVGGPVTYTGNAWPGQPIGPTTPLQCVASSYSFDQTTGQLFFFPNFLQRSVVVYNIREFRGGVFVGSCQREMTFYVRTCTNIPPSGIYNSATAGEIIDSTHFQLCSGMGAFSIFMNPTDVSPLNNITVSATGLPAGATFTTVNNGTNHPNCTFSWNTTGVTPGTYVFFVTFADDNCPNPGTLTRAFTVVINPAPLPVTGTYTVCVGATTTLADGTAGGTWTSSAPGVATVNSGTGVVTGVSGGTAVITYNLPMGCVTTATVTVNPFSAGTISGPNTVCAGSTITLTDAVAGGVWSASGSAVTISPGGIVTGVSGGTATISYTTSSVCGITSATLIVTVNTFPVAAPITGPSVVCQSLTITLADATPGGMWSSGSTNAAVSATGIVSGITSGTATISYSVTNSCGTAVATKVITIDPLPNAGIITGAGAICAGSTLTMANTTTGGTWSTTSGNATITTAGVVTGVLPGTAIISYTVTNSCGPSSATAIVTINSLPTTGSITGPSAVCEGTPITLTASVPGGTWSSGSVNATVTTAGVVTVVSTGTATISYSVTNSCGTAVATKIVTVTLLPVAGIISGPSVVCVGATVSLTDPAPGGVWSSTVPGVATVSTGVVTGIAAGTTTISYTVTNSCGTAVAVKDITVNPLPAAGVISGPSSVCLGATITLSTTGSGGAWSSSSANATVSTLGVVTGVAGGTAIISYTATNSCGTAIATKIVTINLFPDAGIISGPTNVCEGSDIALTDPVAGGTWSTGSANASVSATGVVSGITAGTALISYTVVNGCGTATATYIITINPTPDAGSITGPGNVCIGSTITLADTAPGGIWASGSSHAAISSTGVVTGVSAGTATIYYTVTTSFCLAQATHVVTVDIAPDAGVITGGPMLCTTTEIALSDPAPGGTWSCTANASISTAGILTGLTAGTATVSYTVTNSCGTAMATLVVTINLSPDAGTISGPSHLCPGTTITLTESVAGGTWSSASPGIATIAPGGVVTGIAAGVATISYMVSNTLCSAVATKSVTVDPLAVPGTISGDPAVCSGHTITLSSSLPGGTWSSSGSAGTVSPGGVVTGITAGTMIVSYTVINSCGPAVAVKPISINPLPDPGTITGPHAVCIGASITLADAATAWGTWSSSNAAVATISSTGVITTHSPGTTAITYAVVSSTGCSDSASYIVTVSPLPPAGTISGTPQVCVNAIIHLTETETGGTWSSSNAAVATINSTTGVVTAISIGTTTITYTTSASAAGCINSTTYVLTIVATAPFTIHENITQVQCNGAADGSISINIWNGGPGPWQYLWTDGTTAAAISNLAPGSYGIEVTDMQSQCKSGASYTISEPDSIAVMPTIKDDLCNINNGAISLAVAGGTAPYAYHWYDNSTADNVSGLAKGVYTVMVADDHQCKKHLSVDIIEGDCPDITVQGGMTPNGDGTNDYWVIGGLQTYRHNLVQLFDKWGDKVFEQYGYDNKWDGRGKNGSPLPDGTYFYVIKLNTENGAGGKNILTGSMLIKR